MKITNSMREFYKMQNKIKADKINLGGALKKGFQEEISEKINCILNSLGDKNLDQKYINEIIKLYPDISISELYNTYQYSLSKLLTIGERGDNFIIDDNIIDAFNINFVSIFKESNKLGISKNNSILLAQKSYSINNQSIKKIHNGNIPSTEIPVKDYFSIYDIARIILKNKDPEEKIKEIYNNYNLLKNNPEYKKYLTDGDLMTICKTEKTPEYKIEYIISQTNIIMNRNVTGQNNVKYNDYLSDSDISRILIANKNPLNKLDELVNDILIIGKTQIKGFDEIINLKGKTYNDVFGYTTITRIVIKEKNPEEKLNKLINEYVIKNYDFSKKITFRYDKNKAS